MIPDRERGYSIEADTATVHERYQDHAPRAMRTSALGVSNILDGREAIACEVCFPQPKAPRVQKALPPANPSLMGTIQKGAKDRPPIETVARPRGLGGDDSTEGSGDPPMRGE